MIDCLILVIVSFLAGLAMIFIDYILYEKKIDVLIIMAKHYVALFISCIIDSVMVNAWYEHRVAIFMGLVLFLSSDNLQQYFVGIVKKVNLASRLIPIIMKFLK